MMSFKEFLEEDGIDYFVVELPEDQIASLAILNEGQWVQSRKSGYMQRVDAENPSMNQQRHVHVAKSKHINNKNKQAAWNQDTTKHDRKSFNSKIGSIAVVQSIAQQALGLPTTARLEEATKADKLWLQLNESVKFGCSPILFKLVKV
jgi:hypothetical protein